MNINHSPYTHIVGIDPGQTNTGLAVYNTKEKDKAERYEHLYTGSMYDAIQYLKEHVEIGRSVFILEDPNLDSPVFGMAARIVKVVRSERDNQSAAAKISAMLKQAQDVGRNKACAVYWKQILEANNLPHITVAPSKRDLSFRVRKGKDPKTGKQTKRKERVEVRGLSMPTKTTQAQFEALTGHKGRSTEHARDAGTLVYGRTCQSVLLQWNLNRARDRKAYGGKGAPHPANGREYIIERR